MRSFWKQSTALNPLKREGQNREVPRRSRDALQATAVEEVVEEYLPRWVNDSVSCGWPARSFWGGGQTALDANRPVIWPTELIISTLQTKHSPARLRSMASSEFGSYLRYFRCRKFRTQAVRNRV